MERAGRFFAIALLLILGCRGEGHVRDAVKRSNRAQLLADAAALQQRFRSEVPESQWPATFRAFEPQSVSVQPHGVFLQTHRRMVESAGLFIRLDPAYQPPPNADPGFTEIAPDLYWSFSPG